MPSIKIYHNPRCTTSRKALDILKEHKQDPQVVEYLKTPPSRAELKDLLVKLHMKPFDIVRKKEKLFKDQYEGKKFNDEEWLTILAENPVLIERPIVVSGNKAVICRPMENINAFL